MRDTSYASSREKRVISVSIRKKMLLCVGFLLTVAVALGLFQSIASFNRPIVDWAIVADERLSLSAGEMKVGYDIPRAPMYGIWPQFQIESKYPVTLGFVTSNFHDLMPSDLQDRMVPIRCETEHVRKTMITCSELKVRQESYMFFIFDERPAGAAGANSVHVHYEARKCVSNCKSL